MRPAVIPDERVTIIQVQTPILAHTDLMFRLYDESLESLYLETEGTAGSEAYKAYRTHFALWARDQACFRDRTEARAFFTKGLLPHRANFDEVEKYFKTFLGQRRQIGTWPGANLFFWGQVCADVIKFEHALADLLGALETREGANIQVARLAVNTLLTSFAKYFSPDKALEEIEGYKRDDIKNLPEFRYQRNTHLALGQATIEWLRSFDATALDTADEFRAALAQHQSLQYLLRTRFNGEGILPQTTLLSEGTDIVTENPINLAIFTLDLIRLAASSAHPSLEKSITIKTDGATGLLSVQSSLPSFKHAVGISDVTDRRITFGALTVHPRSTWSASAGEQRFARSTLQVQLPALDGTSYGLGAAARAAMPTTGMLFL